MWTYQTKVLTTLLTDYEQVYDNVYQTIVAWAIEGKTLDPIEPSTRPVPVKVGPDSIFEIVRPWDTQESANGYINLLLDARRANEDPGIEIDLFVYSMEENPTVIEHFEYK